MLVRSFSLYDVRVESKSESADVVVCCATRCAKSIDLDRSEEEGVFWCPSPGRREANDTVVKERNLAASLDARILKSSSGGQPDAMRRRC